LFLKISADGAHQSSLSHLQDSQLGHPPTGVVVSMTIERTLGGE
jgi:hypothetical protein